MVEHLQMLVRAFLAQQKGRGEIIITMRGILHTLHQNCQILKRAMLDTSTEFIENGPGRNMTKETKPRHGRLFSQAQRVVTAVALIALTCYGTARADAIHDAAKKGDLPRAKMLVERDPSLVNRKDEDGNTALHLAAGEGHTEVVAFLLANGADVNAQNGMHDTPLHRAAASGGCSQVVRVLLFYHADVNARNRYGDTPLHLAMAGGNMFEAALILKQGADWKARNNAGRTPEDEALIQGLHLEAQFLRAVVASGESVPAPLPPPLPDVPEIDRKTTIHLMKSGFICNEGAFRGGACRELSKLLRKNPDEGLHFEIVAFSGNQALLAQAAVEDHDPRVRNNALGKLTDEAVLAKIALSDADGHLRANAATRLAERSLLLGDQSALQKVAVEATDANVRRTVATMLMDQSVVAKISAEDPDSEVRKAAAESQASYNRQTGLTRAQAAALFRSFVRATYILPADPGATNGFHNIYPGEQYLFKGFDSVDESGYAFIVVLGGKASYKRYEGSSTIYSDVSYESVGETIVHVSYAEVATIQTVDKLVLLKNSTGDTLDSFYPQRIPHLNLSRLLAALHTLCPNAN